MSKINHITNSTNYKLINLLIKRGNHRPYLGMSSLGDPCWRKLYYRFHFASKPRPISGRNKRIFDMGHLAEELVVKHLNKIGISCYADQEEVEGCFKHAMGHIDGRAIGFPEYPDEELLLEIKSAKDKKFKMFYRFGVKKQNIIYYSQMQRYMGKLKLKLTAFVMINKDDSSMYIEFVPFDENVYNDLLRKEKEIIFAESPPPRQWPKGYLDCDYCDEMDICRNGMKAEKNCRTCDNCSIEIDGAWTCSRKIEKEKFLTLEQQLKGCEKWRYGWGL